ncbi:MAG: hypothetical protein F9K45_06215 [Melioribacteraceae bacterium]|nr:MAG: hypothetical protein F9K45_06215 [Melioribacteraceae bacterium]
MFEVVKGSEGEYRILNSRLIYQRIFDKTGKPTNKNIVHFTPESIENNDDKNIVKFRLNNFLFSEILYSVVAE